MQEESDLQRRLDELIMREKMIMERNAPINSGTDTQCTCIHCTYMYMYMYGVYCTVYGTGHVISAGV